MPSVPEFVDLVRFLLFVQTRCFLLHKSFFFLKIRLISNQNAEHLHVPVRLEPPSVEGGNEHRDDGDW